MNTPNDNLSFELSDLSELDYIHTKTLALHKFEHNENVYLPVLEDSFSSKIKDWLKDELNANNVLIFIIRLDGSKIGYAHLKVLPSPNDFTIEKTYGYIQALWIDSSFRRQNIAQKVVQFIESIFKEQNLPYYEVSYSSENSIAQSFWEKQGLAPFSVQCRKNI